MILSQFLVLVMSKIYSDALYTQDTGQYITIHNLFISKQHIKTQKNSNFKINVAFFCLISINKIKPHTINLSISRILRHANDSSQRLIFFKMVYVSYVLVYTFVFYTFSLYTFCVLKKLFCRALKSVFSNK